MPIIQFSERDLRQGRLVKPGWYRVKVEGVGEVATVTDKGPSTNYPVDVTILMNGDTGDMEFAGVPITFNFNSKAIGFAAGFLKAFGLEPEANKRVELGAATGQELDVFIGNKTFNNRILNDAQHQYRAPIEGVQPVEAAKV